jgi:uncharacterized protein YceK
MKRCTILWLFLMALLGLAGCASIEGASTALSANQGKSYYGSDKGGERVDVEITLPAEGQ